MAGIAFRFFYLKLVFLLYGCPLMTGLTGLDLVATLQGKGGFPMVEPGQFQALPPQRTMTISARITGHLQSRLLLGENGCCQNEPQADH